MKVLKVYIREKQTGENILVAFVCMFTLNVSSKDISMCVQRVQ